MFVVGGSVIGRATNIPTGNRMFIITKRVESGLFPGWACISADPTPLQTDQPDDTRRPAGSFSLLYMPGRLASAKGG